MAAEDGTGVAARRPESLHFHSLVPDQAIPGRAPDHIFSHPAIAVTEP